MDDVSTKVVKIPVRILEEDEELRLLKYRTLDEMMRESRYLGNMAIRYAIAFRLEGIPSEIDRKRGVPVHLDTRIYRILVQKRRYLDAGTVATLSRNFALKLLKSSDKDAWEGKKSLPTYRSLFVPFRHQGCVLTVDGEQKPPQFVIEPPFGKRWLSDELLAALKREAPVDGEKRRLILASCFSWKDQGARAVVEKIVSGEYPMGDSQIKINGRRLTVHMTYKLRNVQAESDPEKVCGVNLGTAIPAVCAVNFGPQRLFVGNSSDLWAVQSKFRAERRRKERCLGEGGGSKNWVRTGKEERWIKTYCHALTRQVINFCVNHGCGTIQMAGFGKPRGNGQRSHRKPLVSAPAVFHSLLEYKAREQGIRIVKIDAEGSRCRCSRCGCTADESGRDRPLFVCAQCGYRVNGDYNAARNLSLAGTETGQPVVLREECL